MATQLQDDREITSEGEDQENLRQLWIKRFKEAENFRKPYDRRDLRMYKLYRAYRDWNGNYAYNINLMPPIGYEIIETIKPRLAAAKVNVRIMPTKKEDIESPSITKWDNLIHYFFDITGFADKKTEWIDTQLKYGNGTMQVSWDNEDPFLEVCDKALLYIDPQAKTRGEGARWIIKRSWKEKEIIKKEEKDRGEDSIYIPERVEELENQPVKEDPRRDRQQITNMKMGQIDDGARRDNSADTGSGEQKADHPEYKAVELWECYDFISQKIVTIGNREIVIREEDNPYKNINKDRNPGNLFIDLPCVSLPWEYHAIPILEPVETTIYEIADGRNQAMDNIVYNLDPITKIRKGKGYKKEDFKKEPGSMWFIDRADDVVTERPAEISKSWIEKDEILRREIQTSLALSEYTQGMPKSAQEPMGKVELLLMQTNIRFSLLVRQMENAFTDLVNILIELSQEFLSENRAMRIVGDDLEFDEFTEKDKKVYIDARVDIIPKKEKSPEQESQDVLGMYKLFVEDDKPETGDPRDMFKWKKKKAALQKLILERLGYEEYEDVLIDEPEQTQPPQTEATQIEGTQTEGTIPPEGIADMPVPQIMQTIPEKEPILPPEGGMIPGSTTGLTEPSPGIIKRLMQRIRG